jgi:hypothetical protein
MRHAGERCVISLLPIVRATAYDVRSCKLPISPESIKMRLIMFIVAMIAASAPAGAQGWREYEYPNEGFTAAFPAEPKVKTMSYRAPGGRLVEARVYCVVREGGEFKSRSPICRIPRCQKATSWPMRY